MAEAINTVVEAPVIAPKVEEPKEKTVEEIQEVVAPKPKETVGLDKFLEVKNDNKALKQSVKDLQAKIEAGGSKAEVTADIEALSIAYPDVDKQFLAQLTAAIRSQVKQDADKEVDERLKPFEQEAKDKRINEAFETHYASALEKLPEFAKIANKDVIKALTLSPKNANKTFTQIIEEAYGNAIPGRRTIETTVPGGGKEPAPLEFDRARKDGAYFNEVMASPKLKAEYNAEMLKRGF